jgi:hypothetical protein
MAVSKRTRYEVLRRDNHTCRYCGESAPDVKLTVDHVLPIALGGTDAPDNLVAACRDCNAGKSSTAPDATLVEEVKQSDLKFAEAMKRAADVRAAARDVEEDYCDTFLDAWPRYRHRALPRDVEQKLVRLYRAGLPERDMIDAAFAAAHNPGIYNRFAYFMGICWNKITELQEVARALLNAEEAD